MKYEDLSRESKQYLAKYINNSGKTVDEAMKEFIVMEVIKEYESNK